MHSKDLFEIDAATVRRAEMTIEKLFQEMTTAAQPINPNPIGQRPPTNAGYQDTKNVGIIESILGGYGVDTIYLRDMTVYDDDHPIRKVYANVGYLVVDGGHRCRAIRQFIENKFFITLDSKKVRFRDLQGANTLQNPELIGIYEKFMNATVAVKYIVCTSSQAHEWFLMINKMTKTNEIESVMSDDESDVTRFIRSKTWYVKEYNNRAEIHPIFTVYYSEKSDFTTDIWNKANTGGSFYLYAFVTLAKAIGKGNVNAGEAAWKKIKADNYNKIDNLTKGTIQIFERFFDDLHGFQKVVLGKKGGLDDDIFGFFSAFWFRLLKKYSGINRFKFDMETLAPLIFRSRTLLTIKNGSRECGKYDGKVVQDIDGNDVELKSLVRQYAKTFSDGAKQEFLGDIILREINEVAKKKDGDNGIIVMDSKRSLSLKNKKELFAAQMNKCWLDANGHRCESAGKKLTIDDCVLAHDTPYTYGGKASDGVIMCKACHKKQGLMKLNEFVTYCNSGETVELPTVNTARVRQKEDTTLTLLNCIDGGTLLEINKKLSKNPEEIKDYTATKIKKPLTVVNG